MPARNDNLEGYRHCLTAYKTHHTLFPKTPGTPSTSCRQRASTYLSSIPIPHATQIPRKHHKGELPSTPQPCGLQGTALHGRMRCRNSIHLFTNAQIHKPYRNYRTPQLVKGLLVRPSSVTSLKDKVIRLPCPRDTTLKWRTVLGHGPLFSSAVRQVVGMTSVN
jgi:hypothetical protein